MDCSCIMLPPCCHSLIGEYLQDVKVLPNLIHIVCSQAYLPPPVSSATYSSSGLNTTPQRVAAAADSAALSTPSAEATVLATMPGPPCRDHQYHSTARCARVTDLILVWKYACHWGPIHTAAEVPEATLLIPLCG